MTAQPHATELRRDPINVERTLALIERGQQLAGHFPSGEDLDRARRILTGELSPDAARAEARDSVARVVAEERASRLV